MNIYTLVLQDRHIDVVIKLFTDADTAINHAKEIAKQYPSYEEVPSDCLIFNASLSCEGDRIWIELCELIGGDHE